MELPLKKLTNFCKEHNIELMILFGSHATDKSNKKSDVDLAIKVKDISSINNNKLKVLNEISTLLNYKEIDLILLNHADPLLKFNIANEGKLIYEKEEGLFNIFKVRAMSENNDAQKFYDLEKKSIENYLERGRGNGEQGINPPQIK